MSGFAQRQVAMNLKGVPSTSSQPSKTNWDSFCPFYSVKCFVVDLLEKNKSEKRSVKPVKEAVKATDLRLPPRYGAAATLSAEL